MSNFKNKSLKVQVRLDNITSTRYIKYVVIIQSFFMQTPQSNLRSILVSISFVSYKYEIYIDFWLEQLSPYPQIKTIKFHHEWLHVKCQVSFSNPTLPIE